MKFRLIAALCVTSFITVAASATNLVVNPNFAPDADQTYDGNGYGKFDAWTQSLNQPLGGFPYLSGSNTIAGPFYSAASGVAPELTVGFVQAFGGTTNDTLSQTIATVAGQLYSYSYYESARPGNDPTVIVSIGDQTLQVSADPSGTFVLYSGTFVADANNEVLAFEAYEPGGQDQTALFTDVNISAVSPEPSSLILLGTGLIGAAGAARRKLRK